MKLTAEDIPVIRARYAAKERVVDIAADYGDQHPERLPRAQRRDLELGLMRRLLRDYGVPIALVVVVVLVGAGLIIWSAMQPNGGCPAHTVSTVSGYIPLVVGKIVMMEPITSCRPV